MPATLDQIVAATRRKLAETCVSTDRSELERRAEKHVLRGFRRALLNASQNGIAAIAELKKASPSKGLIREDFDPESLARELQSAGAAALSVLTDAEFFQGALRNLRIASSAVTIPCLRKDFIVDEFQVIEARANAADAILLIVAALSQPELTALARSASRWDLDVLCEVHDRDELSRAIDAGANLIGVNSRNLKTFHVDLNKALELSQYIPNGMLRVAESGIHSASDITRLRAAGYHAYLIGESLMRAAHPGEALKALLESKSAGPISSEVSAIRS